MMRLPAVLAAAAMVTVMPAAPLAAEQKRQWTHDGKYYASYEECRRAKKRSRDRAAVAGAAGGAAVAAIAGGNLGEAALAAGAGALAGSVIGKNAKKC